MGGLLDWGVVGEVANSVGAVLAALALLYSMTTFKKSLKVSHYTEIDRSYFEILKLALEHPFVQHPDRIKSDDERSKYDLYAFMMWNFIESIHDRCMSDKDLMETWMPIIETEGKRHIAWFVADDNQPRFKGAFRKFVRETIKS